MSAGYSGTPLVTKLGIKPGMRVAVLAAPMDYVALLGGLPDDVRLTTSLRGSKDVVHVFVTRRVELARRIEALRSAVFPAGMVWVSWPKQASGVATDVTEDVVRALALANGLVDVKVCAVDETWSGLKLVVRRELR
jgi:hypothetical protein